MKQQIEHIVKAIESISLKEMDGVSLMKRTVTKFVIHEKHLIEVLESIKDQYRVMVINENRILPYSSLYFDTPTKKFYLDHHNRKENDNKRKIQGSEDHFKFHIETSYKHKINDFTLKYRLRYQNKNELGISNSEGDYANQHIRFKTFLGYNFKNWKIDPKNSAEIFNHFEEGEDNGFDKYRFTLGTEYKFKKTGTVGLFYRYEK